MPYVDERHYRVSELAKLWGVSRDTITRRFQNEPGVLRFGNDNARTGRRRHRHYVVLSIPESVVQRVMRRLSEPSPSLVA